MQWFTRSDWSLEIEAGIPDPLDPAWSEAMAGHGWSPEDNKVGVVLFRQFPDLDAQGAATAARMLVGALQAYGIGLGDLRHHVESPRGLRLLAMPTRS